MNELPEQESTAKPAKLKGFRGTKSKPNRGNVEVGDESTVSSADMAKLLELSIVRVRELAAEGVMSRAGHDRYLLLQSNRAYIRYLRALAHKKPGGGEDDQGKTWEHWRALRMKAAAETMQLDLDRKRRRLVTASEVEIAWADIFATIRGQLGSWASRLAPRTFAAESLQDHRDIFDEEVDLFLRDLSGGEVAVHAPEGDEPEGS